MGARPGPCCSTRGQDQLRRLRLSTSSFCHLYLQACAGPRRQAAGSGASAVPCPSPRCLRDRRDLLAVHRAADQSALRRFVTYPPKPARLTASRGGLSGQGFHPRAARSSASAQRVWRRPSWFRPRPGGARASASSSAVSRAAIVEQMQLADLADLAGDLGQPARRRSGARASTWALLAVLAADPVGAAVDQDVDGAHWVRTPGLHRRPGPRRPPAPARREASAATASSACSRAREASSWAASRARSASNRSSRGPAEGEAWPPAPPWPRRVRAAGRRRPG